MLCTGEVSVISTASKITLLRIAMVPVFMAMLLLDFRFSRYFALAIFIVASATDAVDGYVARKYNQITDFGKFIDPLADKLLVTSALLVFIQLGQLSALAAMIIITREFAVTGLRLVAASKKRVIAAGISGKVKTVVSMIAISIMLTPLHRLMVFNVSLNTICIWAMVLTTVWSGIEYFSSNFDVMGLDP